MCCRNDSTDDDSEEDSCWNFIICLVGGLVLILTAETEGVRITGVIIFCTGSAWAALFMIFLCKNRCRNDDQEVEKDNNVEVEFDRTEQKIEKDNNLEVEFDRTEQKV